MITENDRLYANLMGVLWGGFTDKKDDKWDDEVIEIPEKIIVCGEQRK